jgi:hypothetical protein
MKSLGDSMFGHQAQQELTRQGAIAKGAENQYAQPLADAVRAGDKNALAYYGVLARKTGRDTADFNLLSRSNHANGLDDSGLALAQVGAHEPAGSTFAGQGRQLANQTGIAHIQADTQAATQRAITERQNEQAQWTDQHTLVDVQRPDGTIVKVPKSQVSDVQGQGYRTPMTLDQAKVGFITGQGTQAPSTVAGPAQSGPPALTQDQRSMIGLPTGTQTYMHPGLRMSAVSHDGGQTITLPDGRTMPANGSGFLPASNEAALQQSKDNLQIQEAQRPLAGANPQGPSQAAIDAQTAAGSVPRLVEHANSIAGVVPGGNAVLRAVGAPIIGPGTINAQQNQDQRTQETVSTLMGNPNRPSNYSSKQVAELLPQEGYFASGAVEANKVTAIQHRLQQDYAEAQAIAQNPNTPPDVRQKQLDYMRRVQKTYSMWAAPPAQQPQQPQAPAPQQAPATGPKMAEYQQNPQYGQGLDKLRGQLGDVVIQNGYRYRRDGTPLGPVQ